MHTRVADVMTRDVLAVAPDTMLSAVAHLLELQGISGCPVIDEGGRPLGVVSRTDLLACHGERCDGGSHTYYRLWNGEMRTVGRVVDDTHGPRGVVSDVMTPHVCAIAPGADLRDAAEQMSNAGIHRLVVLDRGRIVGILSAADCVRELARR
jgi:CBS domain-containing membrane protein